MKSVCFFASYFPGNELPYYIRVYLQELKRHFQSVVLLASNPELSAGSKFFLEQQTIDLQIETNEGYDFGLWYKAFLKQYVSAYDRVVLVNDSCILFSPLDGFVSWLDKDPAAYKGMTVSEARAPHLQSYFLVLEKPAIEPALAYFKEHGILHDLEDVISTYEVGLSTHLLSKRISMSEYCDNGGYKGEFSPYYRCVKHHLSHGMPLIKKKILFCSYRRDELFTLARMDFKIDPDYYIRMIKASNKTLILDLEQLKKQVHGTLNAVSKLRYALMKHFIRLFRPLYKGIRRA